MKAKATADFDRFLRITQQSDPYQHLRSIHHAHVMFNYGSSLVTHASLQVTDFASAPSSTFSPRTNSALEPPTPLSSSTPGR
jgi:hypothetical protein